MKFQLTPEILDKIDQYLSGTLDTESVLAFEKQMNEIPELKEEVFLQKMLHEALSDDLLDSNALQQRANQPEYQSLSKKIKQAGKAHQQKENAPRVSPRTKLFKTIPALAAIFLVLILSTIYFWQGNKELDQYYEANVDWDKELISFAEKGGTQDVFQTAEKAFKAKDYAKTIETIAAVRTTDEKYPFALIYRGAAHLELEQYEQALQAFSELSAMTAYEESSKGFWYTAMVYLKEKDRPNAIRSLKKVVSNPKNYRFEEAREILNAIQK